MKRTKIKSSNLKSLGYDEEARILEVEFQSGLVYQYGNVPRKAYASILKAESHGKAFHQHVLLQGYKATRTAQPPPVPSPPSEPQTIGPRVLRVGRIVRTVKRD